MRSLMTAVFGRRALRQASVDAADVAQVNRLRREYANVDEPALSSLVKGARSLPEVVALTAVVASRAIGLQMFDGQIQGALALASGKIVEMPTGEGKTLAAVPAIVWHARSGDGVHVLTANDYLARRDAEWMREIYERLGVTVSFIGQDMPVAARRAAYRTDVTYATANEVGFDYLRDGLVEHSGDQVLRGLSTAVIDEADSLLIDEARIPLVIASSAAGAAPPGGRADGTSASNATDADARAVQADRTVRGLLPGRHFTVESGARTVVLTAAGVTCVERAMGVSNLFEPVSLLPHTAVQDALHAHALLHRDVDYVVHDNAIQSVDEFKGRIVRDRRWPAGLQTALECKEGVNRRVQGRVFGSITIQHLVGLYSSVCGMTGTAATQAGEFREVYGLEVEVIPPNRPIIRDDRPDWMFATKAEKELAVAAEVRRLFDTGRPVLVGTASVEESERLSRALGDVPHHVLNARHEADEAAIIARAGEAGAVTISTNMAGRGVDIGLGRSVAERGGLHVIGTNRHDSRRIDHQLRGRAGRQGDPGSSEFFVSREDPLMRKHDPKNAGTSADQLQRIAEGQNLDIRLFLRKYESIVEGQRLMMAARRQAVLTGELPERDRLITLAVIDDLWADFLAAVTEVRAGTTWVSIGYGKPLNLYLRQVHAMYGEMEQMIAREVTERLSQPDTEGARPSRRGTTWTYLTTDEPFGPMTERIFRRIVEVARRRF